MAELYKCGIEGCASAPFKAGYGTRGGDKPRCQMHLQRERRAHKRKNDPERMLDHDKKRHTARVMFNCTPEMRRWMARTARKEGFSLSEWVRKVLSAAVPA